MTMHALLAKHPSPWAIPDRLFECGYGRYSQAIVDANGAVVLFLDPSEEEYKAAMSFDVAELLVTAINEMSGGS